MQATTFEFESIDGSKIFARRWTPETDETINGVLQISHGMAEHSNRYAQFAEFMTSNGFVVYANDHRGHGKNVDNVDKLGFIAPENGWQLVVEDVFSLNKLIKKENNGLPVFLLGHSFGSVTARASMSKYGKIFDGIILSGTTGTSKLLISAGKIISSLQGLFVGKDKKSKLMDSMSFKDFNNHFKPAKTAFDWLSRDHERNQDYVDDPFCGTVFTNRFFYDMLSMMQYISNKTNLNNLPKDIPIFMISGDRDPVGDFGKGVKMVYNNYKQFGVEDINLKLYKDARHELLNETNRKEIYEDIIKWINEHIKK